MWGGGGGGGITPRQRQGPKTFFKRGHHIYELHKLCRWQEPPPPPHSTPKAKPHIHTYMYATAPPSRNIIFIHLKKWTIEHNLKSLKKINPFPYVFYHATVSSKEHISVNFCPFPLFLGCSCCFFSFDFSCPSLILHIKPWRTLHPHWVHSLWKNRKLTFGEVLHFRSCSHNILVSNFFLILCVFFSFLPNWNKWSYPLPWFSAQRDNQCILF